MGLDWDAGPDKDDGKGPYYQMQRLPIYEQYIQQLIDDGKAYYAWETAEEIEIMRESAYKAKKPFNYRKPDYSKEQLQQFQDEWRKPVVRFAIDEAKVVTFTDGVKGETTFAMKEFGDFVIQKSDGIPTYYLANVIDDALQEVTYVIRGEEHLSNTPKQAVLYEALWFIMPQFAHLPLMLNKSGKKMSKRDTDLGLTLVHQFQQAGFLPEAIINFIALLGWNPGTEQEIFTLDQLIESFSMERVQKANAVYDFKRALWFNGEWIKNLSDESFVEKVKGYLYLYGNEEWKEIIEHSDDGYWLTIAPQIKQRLQTFEQFKDYCQYFFVRKTCDPAMVNSEKMHIDDVLVHGRIHDCLHMLESLSDNQWTEETLKEQLIDFIAAKELKNGQVLWPIRCMVTGVEASPGAFEMLAILGKEESLVRLQEYHEALIERIKKETE